MKVTTSSFLNNKSKVTNVNDILDRMRNADSGENNKKIKKLFFKILNS